MHDKPYFDESSSPVQTVDFDHGAVEQAVDGIDQDQAPHDEHLERPRAALHLLLEGGNAHLTLARAAVLDRAMHPDISLKSFRKKWPGVRRHLRVRAVLELEAVISINNNLEGGAK
jgi:hypothetical protein